MTLSRLLLVPACLLGLVLTGCPTSVSTDKAAELKSVVTVTIDPVADNHSFCNSSSTYSPTFSSQAECLAARKYRLRWERPEDTVGFSEYRIFVDTTPPNAAGQTWANVQKDRSLALFTMAGPASATDSLIFVLSPEADPNPVADRAHPRIVKLDTTGRNDEKGKLVFAISTAFGSSRSNGQPRFTWVITNDLFAPYPLQTVFAPKARSVEVSWVRPGDPTSFFDPGADSGLIRGYYLRVVRGSNGNSPVPFNPQVTLYSAGGVNRTSEVTMESFVANTKAPGRRFWFPDSQRAFDRVHGDARDSMRVIVSGLSPQDTLKLALWAIDLSGNATDSGTNNTKFLTDTTQPTTPVLQLVDGSVTRNGFIYTFSASRDLVPSGAGLEPAAKPNANIQQYVITRRRTSGTVSIIDSLFKPAGTQRALESFTDTVRYLPPGTSFQVSIYSVDSTGHTSETGTLNVTTLSAAFTGADSGATCPSGFISMPSGRFVLGTSGGTGDEAPNAVNANGTRGIGSYCIEQYEHQSAGVFQNKVTWEQARDVCAAVSPGNGSHLCTEGEWERACEGTGSTPLVYGIQSEVRNPQNVRFACNIGTNDSAMANKLSLRDPTCLSTDGAFDMSGNFAEWVLDPYTTSYPSGDTLIVGQSLTTLTDNARRGYRGTHYLNTNQSPATMQSAGRCSNRTEARQLRPKPYAGCTDATYPKLVVTYATKAPRCLTLPDSLLGRAITSVQTGRDTNDILILLPGQTKPITYTLPKDTNYRLLKPVTTFMAPRALAVVTFVNSETSEAIVDTLDATEMLTASAAGLTTLFAREASPPWSVKKVNGQFEIRYLYAYSVSQGVQTRKFYSNELIGFRCCSNPVPAVLGKRRALPKR